MDAAPLDARAQMLRQRRAKDKGLLDAGDVATQFRSFLQQKIEKSRLAAEGVGLQGLDGVELPLDGGRACGDHGAAQHLRAAFHHVSGGGQVIGKAVQNDVAARKARRMHAARTAPPILGMTFQNMGKQAAQKARARGVEAAKGRIQIAHALHVVAAHDGKLRQFFLAAEFGDFGGADQAAQPGRARLGDSDDRLEIAVESELTRLDCSRLQAIHEIRHTSSPRSGSKLS